MIPHGFNLNLQIINLIHLRDLFLNHPMQQVSHQLNGLKKVFFEKFYFYFGIYRLFFISFLKARQAKSGLNFLSKLFIHIFYLRNLNIIISND